MFILGVCLAKMFMFVEHDFLLVVKDIKRNDGCAEDYYLGLKPERNR